MGKKNKNNSNERHNSLVNMLKGVIIGYIFTIVVFVIYAFLITYTNVSEENIQVVVMITTGVSVLIAGFITAKNVDKNGLVWGMGAGGFYGIIIILTSLCLKEKFSLESRNIITLLISIIFGGLGGILGINKK